MRSRSSSARNATLAAAAGARCADEIGAGTPLGTSTVVALIRGAPFR